MNRESITQEYFILSTTDKGTFPLLNSDESKAGLIAAGTMDLLYSEVITLNKKIIEVVKELPDELMHLAFLYEFLKGKKRSTNKVMEYFNLNFTSKTFNEYYNDIGSFLAKSGIVELDTLKFFGDKTLYIPDEGYKQRLIDTLKKDAISKDELQFHDVAIISLLKETKNLNQYFSAHEYKLIKNKLKEIRKNPNNKPIKEMIGYIDEMCTMIALITIFMSN